jgi:hypothetical protein
MPPSEGRTNLSRIDRGGGGRAARSSTATSSTRGTHQVYIGPATRRLNDEVGTLHDIGEEESYRVLAGVVVDDARLFDDGPREWEESTTTTAHGLDGQTAQDTHERRPRLV